AQLCAGGSPSLAALAAKEEVQGCVRSRGAANAVARAVALSALAPPEVRSALWAPDERGRPPLVAAACCGGDWGQTLMRALLAARAQPDASSIDGWNALMWACQLGDREACSTLLQGKASANAVSQDGTSPLLNAVRADKEPLAIVRLLLEYGADPALVPMQSPFDEYVDMDVREALARAPQRPQRRCY
ncbi:unnamed protein product, partial [Polarella glacialis]